MFQWMIVSQSVPFLVKNLRSFGMTSTRYVVHRAWQLTSMMHGLTLICLTITIAVASLHANFTAASL